MATTIIDNLITKLGFRVDDAQLQRVRQRLQGLKDFAGNIAGQMTIAGAALTGMLYKVGATVFGFEKSQNQLQATLGATAEQMKEVRAQSLLLGRTTRFTASEVSGAQNQLAQMGFAVNEVMSITPHVLNLAAAGNLDMAQAAGLVATQLRAYNLEATESQRVTDILAKTATISATTVEELASPFRQLGTAPALLNQSLEQTAAIVGTLRNSGLLPEQAGTGLRNIFIRLSRLMKDNTMQEDLKEMGVSEEDLEQIINLVQLGKVTDAFKILRKTALDASKGPEALANAVKLFEAESGIAALTLATNIEKVEEYTEVLYGAEGAAEEMRKTQGQGIVGAIYNFQSALEGLQLSLGEAGLTGWITSAASSITTLVSWLTELPPHVRGFAAAAIAAGPALTILGASLRLLSMAVSGLAVLFTPIIGLAILVVALIVAIFWWDEFVAAIETGWNFLKNNPTFAPLITSMEALWTWFTEHDLVKTISAVWTAIGEPIVAVIKTDWDAGLWMIIGLAWGILRWGLGKISALVDTIWDDAIWPTIKDTWAGRSLETIVGLVRAQFEPETWNKIKTEWEKEGVVGVLFVGVEAFLGSDTYNKMQTQWQNEGFLGAFGVLVDAKFGEGIWAKLETAWAGGKDGEGGGIAGALSVVVDAKFGAGTWNKLKTAWAGGEDGEGGGIAGLLSVFVDAKLSEGTWTKLKTAWAGGEDGKGGGIAETLPVLVDARFGKGVWEQLKTAWAGGEDGTDNGIAGVLPVLVDVGFGEGTWTKLKAGWDGGEDGTGGGIAGVLSVLVDTRFGEGVWEKLKTAWSGGEDGEGGGIVGVLPVLVDVGFGAGTWETLKTAWSGGEDGEGGGIAGVLGVVVDVRLGEGAWETLKTSWEENGVLGVLLALVDVGFDESKVGKILLTWLWLEAHLGPIWAQVKTAWNGDGEEDEEGEGLWNTIQTKWTKFSDGIKPVVLELKTSGLEAFQTFFDNFTKTIEERGGAEAFNILIASLMNLGTSLRNFGKTLAESLGADTGTNLLDFLVELAGFAGSGAGDSIVSLANALTLLSDALQWFVDNVSLASSGWISFFQALNNPKLAQTPAEQAALIQLAVAETPEEIEVAEKAVKRASGSRVVGSNIGGFVQPVTEATQTRLEEETPKHKLAEMGLDMEGDLFLYASTWLQEAKQEINKRVLNSFNPNTDFTGTPTTSAGATTEPNWFQNAWTDTLEFFDFNQPALAPAGVGAESGGTVYNVITQSFEVGTGAVQVDARGSDGEEIGRTVGRALEDELRTTVDDWDRDYER